jgi:hypothetical protein
MDFEILPYSMHMYARTHARTHQTFFQHNIKHYLLSVYQLPLLLPAFLYHDHLSLITF